MKFVIILSLVALCNCKPYDADANRVDLVGVIGSESPVLGRELPYRRSLEYQQEYQPYIYREHGPYYEGAGRYYPTYPQGVIREYGVPHGEYLQSSVGYWPYQQYQRDVYGQSSHGVHYPEVSSRQHLYQLLQHYPYGRGQQLPGYVQYPLHRITGYHYYQPNDVELVY